MIVFGILNCGRKSWEYCRLGFRISSFNELSTDCCQLKSLELSKQIPNKQSKKTRLNQLVNAIDDHVDVSNRFDLLTVKRCDCNIQK